MNSLSGLILFLILIFGSLMIVSLVNQLQTRHRLIHQKIGQLRRRLDELEEICAAIEPLLESVLVPKVINDEVQRLIDSILQLDPSANFVEIKRDNANTLADRLNAELRTQPFYRALGSDASIARHKYYLTETARIIRRVYAQGRLQSAELDSYLLELSWAHLMVDVISNVVQGHKAVNRNDVTVAYGYYRKAQNMLISSNLTDERRHRFIRELGEIFSGKRLAISSDLMPESEFNPTKKPHFNLNEGAADSTA